MRFLTVLNIFQVCFLSNVHLNTLLNNHLWVKTGPQGNVFHFVLTPQINLDYNKNSNLLYLPWSVIYR